MTQSRLTANLPIAALLLLGGWLAIAGAKEPASPATTPAAPLTAADAESLFLGKVWPMMRAKCLACHGEDEAKIKGGLDLRTLQSTLKGGDSGTASVVPGSPDKSPLYAAVTRHDEDLAMPPKENDKLSAEQVEQVRLWIAAGAPWPDPSKPGPVVNRWNEADGVTVPTSGGLSADWTNRRYKPDDLWAYQPIANPGVPKIPNGGANTAIDAFILQRLQNKGITDLAEPADQRTLIRRVTLDLTGLPPTADEVAAFVNDNSPGAFTRLVDRLLDSPQYGEQQARHWLDVVRYADTAGFSNDFERPNAWRFRDYIIRSFNADKPFDRFILEQIAGDELDPGNPEMPIAVGFLRMGPWEHTAMTVAAVTRQQYLDDVTHSVGVTFLGQGLRCASCHDHKFDPVPTRDYYRLQAVFASTQLAERDVPFLPQENVTGFEAQRKVVEQRLAELRQRQSELRQRANDGLARFLKEKGVERIEDLPPGERPKKDYLGSTAGISNLDLSLRKIYKKSEDYLERELMRFEPVALSVYAGPANSYTSVKLRNPVPGRQQMARAEVQQVHILTGGSIESPAEAVTPGVLSAVAGSNDTLAPSDWNRIPTSTEGRRLQLARWIASPQNTLTARVIVNRIWQQHFGHGLVATPNNFGKMGGKPTHPELLDHLASWFIENGWSNKKLHRYILASRTYQQAGTRSDKLPNGQEVSAIDPKNELLSFYPPRRLSAEEIRDAMLAASGELNLDAGGPGVFPEINWEVAMQPRHIMGSVAPAYIPSATPAERNRRTIYAFRYRTLPDPMLEVFNRPGSEMSCEKRDETTVTPQVFALFNSQFTASRSLAMATDVAANSKAVEAQIAEAFRRVYGRSATADERDACLAHYRKMLDHHRKTDPVAAKLPEHVERHMVEELTGEPVAWQEDLSVLKGFQQDLQPTQVPAEVRALAEVCLVLLNSNEFLYVR